MSVSSSRAPHAVWAGVRCHDCSRSFHPKDVIRLGDVPGIGGGAVRCFACQERQTRAITEFAQTAIPACYECKRTVLELNDEDGKGNVRMHLHLRDGCYQLLCGPCSRQYVRKRVDLFGDTLYGDKLKLKGTK